jgi:hypothetical protein
MWALLIPSNFSVKITLHLENSARTYIYTMFNVSILAIFTWAWGSATLMGLGPKLF